MSSRVGASMDATDLPATRATENPVYLQAVGSAMRAIEQVIADIALTDIPVLLVGESGTGKDVVGLYIHRLSLRRPKPFRKVICSSLTPDALFPSNGNSRSRQGEGRGGTLFLDEVSDLSPTAQSHLIQALSEGELSSGEGLGERLICATSRNLEEQMRAGRFREELYFRINGVCLRLPPLRHRQEDLAGLAEYFLRKYAAQFERPQPSLSTQTLGRLHEHNWPGNIRELENSMKKLVVLGDERMAVADLGPAAEEAQLQGNGSSGISLKEAARAASRQAERELILKVLGRTRWNRKRAALELKISYKALLYKLKQIGLEDLAGS
jgi:two-component system response regulator AtoC